MNQIRSNSYYKFKNLSVFEALKGFLFEAFKIQSK